MLLKNDHSEKRTRIFVSAIIIAVIIAGGLVYFTSEKNETPSTQKTDTLSVITGSTDLDTSSEKQLAGDIVRKEIDAGQETRTMPVIDYNDINDQEKSLKQIMEDRKRALGLDNSLDMVVRSDETFKIGDIHVSMRDILEKAFLDKGDVFVEQIDDKGGIIPHGIKEYGIYVVQPGDNIWNIHFNILKEYYRSKGIHIDPRADEPNQKGLSSGIGKILKFSETMVIIYNLVERQIAKNIDLLQPLSKIVVYNMDEVFSLLGEIDYDNVNQIQFDGKSIWISADKS